MRPVRLRLENFGSYRGLAVELDFAPLELFAISGPAPVSQPSSTRSYLRFMARRLGLGLILPE
jgi:hypothetical protein